MSRLICNIVAWAVLVGCGRDQSPSPIVPPSTSDSSGVTEAPPPPPEPDPDTTAGVIVVGEDPPERRPPPPPRPGPTAGLGGDASPTLDCEGRDRGNAACLEATGWYCFVTRAERVTVRSEGNEAVEPIDVERSGDRLCLQLPAGQFTWEATSGAQTLSGRAPMTVEAGERREHGEPITFSETPRGCAQATGLNLSDCLNGLIEEALTYYRAQNYEDATATFRAVLDADPRNARALYNLAVVLEARERPDELSAVADDIIRYSGTFPDSRKPTYKAWAAFFQGRASEMRAAQALAANNRNAARSHLVRAVREFRNLETLVGMFPPDIPIDPQLAAAWEAVPERVSQIEDQLRTL